jgi:hypothetical protein
MSKSILEPWKKTCKLRPEIRERQLTTSDFAVDLHRVVNAAGGKEQPFYCDPERFFSTTYATENLRQFCRVVLRRLAKENAGESVINVAQTFGGGKSHTLTALYYLATLGKNAPKKATSVQAILNSSGLSAAPVARVAAVSFDKVDWVTGCEVKSPEGEVRAFRMPWNLIAWQLLGQKGLDILQRDESGADYNTPPADTLWTKIFDSIEADGRGALILLDEVLMWAHDAASPGTAGATEDRGPAWYDRLKNFFQRLAQAIEASQRSCLVVSLLASDPDRNDEIGRAILNACNNGLNRQASLQEPVQRDDLAELLRQRMFESYPENKAARDAIVHGFWHQMAKVEPILAKKPDARESIADAYPFHPELLNRFFGKWSELHQFQKTRGVLQLFAMALRDAEPWDESPIIGGQVFLSPPGDTGLSEAANKLATVARDSHPSNPPWPMNLQTELPRALNAQKLDAGTLGYREIETACINAFLYSQPIGEQAELSEMRWLLAPTIELPAVLNNGLISWANSSWYLEECENKEAASGVPKFWRLGPKPNLNQLHDSYKRQALKLARGRFDDLVRKRIAPLEEGFGSEPAMSKLPQSPADVDDNAVFRVVLLGAQHAGAAGATPDAAAAAFLRTHSSPSDTRVFQNIVLVVTPSKAGLALAEDSLANWMAWEEVEGSAQFKELESMVQEKVRRNKKEAHQQAQTAVKNAYELVLYVDKTGAVQSKKITLGSQSLLDSLKQEKDLRIFDEKIDASAIMPGGLYPVWPNGVDSVQVADLYQQFGRQPALPKLLRARTVVNTIEDAVRRGLLALRITRSDGSTSWFWRGTIDVVDWERLGEAWLPAAAQLDVVAPAAVLPAALAGLWPEDGSGVKLGTLIGWFDGQHGFEEVTEPGYPAEFRPIPQATPDAVKAAVAKGIESGHLWLVLGNDSVHQERPTAIQLDPDATLWPPPRALASIDLLPSSLPDAWSADAEPATTVEKLYAALKAKEGKPWPPYKFLDTLNAAIGQGFLHRASGTGSLISLDKDGTQELVVKASMPVPLPPPPPDPLPGSNRRATNAAKLSVNELQDFADHVSKLMSTLAGSEPEIEVRVTIQGKTTVDLEAANKLLAEIKGEWRF